jgi:hypothetical protein
MSHRRHLHPIATAIARASVLLLRPLHLGRGKSAITLLVLALKHKVRRRLGLVDHGDEVLERVEEIERAVAVRLGELAARKIFPRRLATAHEEDVVHGQGDGVAAGQDGKDSRGQRAAVLPVGQGVAKRHVVLVGKDEYLGQGGSQHEERKQRSRGDEGEEVSVVTSADAVIEPHAMMVLQLDTVVAVSAVMTSWRSPDLTSLAELGRNLHGSGFGCQILDQGPCRSRRANGQGIFIWWSRREWMQMSRQNLVEGQLRFSLSMDNATYAWIDNRSVDK